MLDLYICYPNTYQTPPATVRMIAESKEKELVTVSIVIRYKQVWRIRPPPLIEAGLQLPTGKSTWNRVDKAYIWTGLTPLIESS